VVKLVLKLPRIFRTVARQLGLAWQPFCEELVGGHPHVSPWVWSWCDHPQWSYDTFYLYTLYARV